MIKFTALTVRLKAMELDDERMKYVKEFCYKYYSYEGMVLGEFTFYESLLPDKFASWYDDIVKSLPKHFNEKEYSEFRTLQEYITYFDLDKNAFWVFLVFMYQAIESSVTKEWVTVDEEVERIYRFVEENWEKLQVQISTTDNKKLPVIKDKEVLHWIFLLRDSDRTRKSQHDWIPILERTDNKITTRKKSYIMVKTIANEFVANSKITKDNPPKGAYTNKERVFYLCILYLCGYLVGDLTKRYDHKNTAPINQLLRDFKDTDVHLKNLEMVFAFNKEK